MDMNIFLIFFVLFMVAIAGLYIINRFEQKGKDIRTLELVKNGFNPTRQLFTGNGFGPSLAIDETSKQISIITKAHGDFVVKRYNITDILNFEVYEEVVNTTNSSNGSPITRAVVGGMLLGGVGAIVGAVSANPKSSTKQKVKRIVLSLTLNDIKDPLVEFNLLNESTEKYSYVYSDVMKEAKTWVSLLMVLKNQPIV